MEKSKHHFLNSEKDLPFWKSLLTLILEGRGSDHKIEFVLCGFSFLRHNGWRHSVLLPNGDTCYVVIDDDVDKTVCKHGYAGIFVESNTYILRYEKYYTDLPQEIRELIDKIYPHFDKKIKEQQRNESLMMAKELKGIKDDILLCLE